MPFTTPPPAPNRNNPSTFSAYMDAFLAWLVVFWQELNSALQLFSTKGYATFQGGSTANALVLAAGYPPGSIEISGIGVPISPRLIAAIPDDPGRRFVESLHPSGAIDFRWWIQREESEEEPRVALDLRFRENLSYAEIGEVMGVPASTVRGLLYRGTLALRLKLKPMLKKRGQ